ncbi:phosphoribosylformylglycinamidine synthase subunit PurQ [bacterium]|nr:phosphoribosylformylglycinamidine synthase subunit PurQ [bacterium]
MTRKTAAVLQFPGTNCDQDTLRWLARNLDLDVSFVRTQEDIEKRPPGHTSVIILPGGFSFGDYLRAGALAARSPLMDWVRREAASGVAVLGICNGFQILCESGLLPGALAPNAIRQHVHEFVTIHVEMSVSSPWAPNLTTGRLLTLPISCGMGNFIAPRKADSFQTLFRYTQNILGSSESIAGISNPEGNIVGMMPHPERASDPVLGVIDGLIMLDALAERLNIPVRSGSPLAVWRETKGSHVH